MPMEQGIVEHLRNRYQPEAIILVGSRADGQFRPGSDWDIYVLIDREDAGPAGPIPAPDVFEGEHLDVGLVYLPVPRESVPSVFGATLQQARILLDNRDGVACAICASARDLYAKGRALSPQERLLRRRGMARELARLRARSDEPGPFFESLTYFFYIAHRYWYEVLHDRWSVSIHRAMPEIQQRDPAFAEYLDELIQASDPATRIRGAEAIYRALFPDELNDR